MSTQASSSLSELPSSLLSEFDYSDIFTSTPIMTPFDLDNSSPFQNALPSTIDSSPKAMDSDSIHQPRTCWVYNHMPNSNPETKYYSKANRLKWKCKYCSKKYALNGGTRCMKSHLKDIHDISKDSLQEEKAKKRQLTIENALISGSSNPQKCHCLQSSDPSDIPLNPDQLEVLYINLITSCNLPLHLVESPTFRELLTFLNNGIDTWLPESHNTVLAWLLRQFDIQKERTKAQLHSAQTVIHLALDLWSSPNGLAILGIIAHYISEDNLLEESVLSVQEVKGDYSGENLAKHTMKTINDYRIVSKLGWLQMDNASSNDTLIRELSVGI